MSQFETIVDSVLLVLGPCLLVFSIVSFVRTRAFLQRSAEVTGEVVRLVASKSWDGGLASTEYAPVFSFNAANGETYTVASNVGSSPAEFSVGDTVRVRYDPVNPQNARIHTWLQTWGAVAVSAVVGMAFVGYGSFKLGLLDWVQ
jgi:hypothetical protein